MNPSNKLFFSSLSQKGNRLNLALLIVFFIITMVILGLIFSKQYVLVGLPLPYMIAICALTFIFTTIFALRLSFVPLNAMLKIELQNKNNQDAILRLIDEIGDLADGDLTVSATVADDITSAIADFVNYTIGALRTLVEQINSITEEVAGAAQKTQSTAQHLINASKRQSQQITEVSSAITEMAGSVEEVSNTATQSSQVAGQSVELAIQGNKAVKKSIQGMNVIREQIQETSKRIKRLGESSQQIGDIVELINDITEQTNILSLNAAIQAAMAGEAGRGFAVVAEEVQRLAERSSNATRQIDALVKTIQSDTSEAISSMEKSTAGVVAGAQLSQDAGTSLEQIEAVSHQLANLIGNITKNARQQAIAAVGTSKSMNVIQEITVQTSTGTNNSAAAIGSLLNLTNELRKSVSDFTLPK